MIRVYKDVDKAGILETVKTIHANAGEISAVKKFGTEDDKKVISDALSKSTKLYNKVQKILRNGESKVKKKTKSLF